RVGIDPARAVGSAKAVGAAAVWGHLRTGVVWVGPLRGEAAEAVGAHRLEGGGTDLTSGIARGVAAHAVGAEAALALGCADAREANAPGQGKDVSRARIQAVVAIEGGPDERCII